MGAGACCDPSGDGVTLSSKGQRFVAYKLSPIVVDVREASAVEVVLDVLR